MDLGLKNKTAVVTGGSSGIGLAVVRKLLAEGANVAFCARNEERLAAVQQQLAEEFASEQIFSQACSVLEPEAVSGFAAAIKMRFGGCDILINNAGQGRVSTLSLIHIPSPRD
jgi:NAD(P)-dependent dehydrogenase (short-subunit alcohol dehydrogenase family)